MDNRILRFSRPDAVVVSYSSVVAIHWTLFLSSTCWVTVSYTHLTYAYEAGPGAGDRYEPNNSITTATAFSFPGRLEATIHNPEDVDVYVFTLENSANLSLTLTPPDGASYSLAICDEKGNTLRESAYAGKSQSIRYPAASGRYLVKVAGMDGNASEAQPYTLSLTREMKAVSYTHLDVYKRQDWPFLVALPFIRSTAMPWLSRMGDLSFRARRSSAFILETSSPRLKGLVM